MKLFKFITFRLIRFIYLFPSIIFYQIKKNKSKYSFNRNRKYLIEKNLSLNNVFSDIENFYLIEKKNQIEKIINDNINKNKYYTEIDYLLDDKLKNKLLEYLNNKDFVNYLSSFFGHQLKFNSFLIRLNFFNSNLPENEGPKMWHRDNDSFFGQIKLFSVLNDLNSNTGGLFSFIPQIYIKDYEFVSNSYDDTKLSIQDRRSRILNSEMNKVKDVSQNIIEFGKNKNQFLAIDTNDTYHKGGLIKQKNSFRLLIQVIYEPYFNLLSNYNSLYNKNIPITYIKNIFTGLKNRLRTQIKI